MVHHLEIAHMKLFKVSNGLLCLACVLFTHAFANVNPHHPGPLVGEKPLQEQAASGNAAVSTDEQQQSTSATPEDQSQSDPAEEHTGDD